MAHRGEGQLRIIGGTHRSRVIEFDPKSGVRPTPDRVRQTLFDWLAPLISGAKCLDLFAGSGALGLEAISRGAAHVTFVETGKPQTLAIAAALRLLKEEARATVEAADAHSFLVSAAQFDVVFLDPPFDRGLLVPTLEKLTSHLAPINRVYLEWREGTKPALPAGYEWLREKQAGLVGFGLAAYRA